MRILLDLQGCQTTSAQRGIGRYSLGLAKALVQHRGCHDFWLTLNARLPGTIAPLRAEFEPCLGPGRIAVFEAPGATALCDPENAWRARAAELIRARFVGRLNPDVVHVSSLFEGLDDDAVQSVPEEQCARTAVTLYDLIPLLNPEAYLGNARLKAWYNWRLESLRRAQLLLAISEYSRQEAIDALDIHPEKIVTISAGADESFCVRPHHTIDEAGLRGRYGLTKPFLLCTAGFDPRKNIDGLIDAYASLAPEQRQDFQLVLSGKISEDALGEHLGHIKRLRLPPSDVIFTNYVPDDDLISLYNLCHLLIVPSIHEGFGLPAVEAMRCGAPVIASDRTSLPEVVGRRDALFDPASVPSMAAKMSEALSNERFRQSLAAHGPVQARAYTWDAAAKRTLDAFAAMAAPFRPRLPAERTGGILPAPGGEKRRAFLARIVSIQQKPGPSRGDLAAIAASIAANEPVARESRVFVDAQPASGDGAGGPLPGLAAALLDEHGACGKLRMQAQSVFICPRTGLIRHADVPGATGGKRGRASVWEYPPADFQAGDIFLGIGWDIEALRAGTEHLRRIRNRGAKVYFAVQDLLPVLWPHSFPPATEELYSQWLQAVADIADGVACASAVLAHELRDWLVQNATRADRRPLKILAFPPGCDPETCDTALALKPAYQGKLTRICERPFLLMTGDIAPHTGHTQAMAAFDLLWQCGVELNLVIVGAPGWETKDLARRLRAHPQYDRRLFWLPGASGELRRHIHASAAGFIAACEAAGSGLPLIEAARHEVPILARDLPVFRETVGEHAYYFSGRTPASLARAIETWFSLGDRGDIPCSGGIACPTWAASVERLLCAIRDGDDALTWPSSSQPHPTPEPRELRATAAGI